MQNSFQRQSCVMWLHTHKVKWATCGHRESGNSSCSMDCGWIFCSPISQAMSYNKRNNAINADIRTQSKRPFTHFRTSKTLSHYVTPSWGLAMFKYVPHLACTVHPCIILWAYILLAFPYWRRMYQSEIWYCFEKVSHAVSQSFTESVNRVARWQTTCPFVVSLLSLDKGDVYKHNK